MKISEHLYLYLWTDQRENNCNSIVIDGKVPLLIDPGHLHQMGDLTNRMLADGFDSTRIKLIINTHCHPDHFEGNQAFEESSAKIAFSQEEDKFLREVGRPAYLKQGMQMPDYRVDFYLREGTLNVGRHEFEVFLTPGHSPGSLCIYWPRHRILFAGDLVFMQGVGRVDLPGGDKALLKESIVRISKIPVELLVPGHGSPIKGAADVKANFQYIKGVFLDRL